ncbi:proline dehydrogenase [Bacillus sp. AGMB 02131]|uniref:proline dehydrogenase n=1 Tax=Peribacillus faecalis TaxID=2772559 RepID=A0A927CV41_9BACI|nr:proline dehydrogenase [Peribacillus faecalis]MBD3108031.1 proline dehydrogenase [Peribacillus faecalis]
MLSQVSKNVFMFASKNKTLNKAAKRWGLQLGASQVVAGTSIDEAMGQVRRLNEQGLICTLDHLGEFVTSRKEAIEATVCNVKTLEAIAESGVESQLSVKLTQLGLDLSEQFCLENMVTIMETAKQTNQFVTIDMEDYSHCQMTLDILKELRKTYQQVGTVIQAYLYRSQQDVIDFEDVPLRLVKGAYKESAEVAFQDKKEIDENFINIINLHLLSGSYTAIATHDHEIIAKVKSLVAEQNISRSQFEFQMLYGFRTELQRQLAEEGFTMRVYVPFGDDWFGYYMRRLAERPQNVAFALKGFFSK